MQNMYALYRVPFYLGNCFVSHVVERKRKTIVSVLSVSEQANSYEISDVLQPIYPGVGLHCYILHVVITLQNRTGDDQRADRMVERYAHSPLHFLA